MMVYIYEWSLGQDEKCNREDQQHLAVLLILSKTHINVNTQPALTIEEDVQMFCISTRVKKLNASLEVVQ